jgi:hypothetical protein
VAGIPTSTGPGELALMLKSVTVTIVLDVCDRVPLAPVVVKLYGPAVVELQAIVAVPEPVIV